MELRVSGSHERFHKVIIADIKPRECYCYLWESYLWIQKHAIQTMRRRGDLLI